MPGTVTLQTVDETQENIDAAWAAEIEERVAAVRAGELESTDWRVVLDRIERDVLGR